jgi:hypothetical protein
MHLFGGFRLEMDIAGTLGQVALVAAALSVTLQDTRGLDLPASAAVIMAYALMAPAGIAVGLATTDLSGRSAVAKALLGKGQAGVGYSLPLLSGIVAGALLYQTLANALPKESRDSEAEWRHKFSTLAAGKAGSSPFAYVRAQAFRLSALLAGWALMASLHWATTHLAGVA